MLILGGFFLVDVDDCDWCESCLVFGAEGHWVQYVICEDASWVLVGGGSSFPEIFKDEFVLGLVQLVLPVCFDVVYLHEFSNFFSYYVVGDFWGVVFIS